MTSRGQCPRGGALVNVQEWGCFSNFLRSDDVTWTMSKGGVLVKNPVSAPGPPPPFQKSWIRACIGMDTYNVHYVYSQKREMEVDQRFPRSLEWLRYCRRGSKRSPSDAPERQPHEGGC